MDTLQSLDANASHLVVESIRQLHDSLGAYIDGQGHTPSPESKADHELDRYPETESLQTSYALGTTLLDEAADFLFGFYRLLTNEIQVFAPWALARGVIETCAIASWLLDPTIEADERVRRGLARRHKGAIEQRKIARLMNDPKNLQSAMTVIKRIEVKASWLGFNSQWKKMPNNTEIIKQELEKEPEHRFFSAVLHGHHFATLAVGYSRSIGDNDILIERVVKPSTICFGAQTVVEAFYIPQKRKVALFGWDEESLEGIFNEFDVTLKSIGLPTITRATKK